MTTSKASKGVNEVTTTNEHNTHEHPTAANYTAGDSIRPYEIPDGLPPDVMQYERGWNACLEALASSHRERSERDVPNGANCAHGQPVARWTEIARDGQLSDWNLEMASLRKYFAGLASQPADKPAGQSVNRSDAAQATDAWPNGEYRLWDSQWMNVVNFDRGYESFDKEDAVNHAVKLTEKYMRENIQRAALSEAKRSHICGDTLAPEPAVAGDESELAKIDHEISVWAGRMSTPRTLKRWPKAKEWHAYLLSRRKRIVEKATPAAAVPDGMVLVPSKIRVPTQAWDDAQCAFGGPDESFMDCTLWVGEIEHDDGKTKTYGLHVSNDDYPEEGSITLAEFTAVPDHLTASMGYHPEYAKGWNARGAAAPNRPADNSQPTAAREAQRGVPAAKPELSAQDDPYHKAYNDGWNDCRDNMLAASPAPAAEVSP